MEASIPLEKNIRTISPVFNLIRNGNGTDFSRAICCVRSMNVTYSR